MYKRKYDFCIIKRHIRNQKLKVSRKIFFSWMVMAVLLSGCAGNHPEREKTESKEVIESQETTELHGTTESQEDENESSVIVFEGQDIAGNSVSSSVFSESKITMVNIWATYCNPCLSEMPGLGELAEEYDPEEFQIIGIISDVPEGADERLINNATALIEATGANYTHLTLNESIYNAFLTDVTAVPTTLFVDENAVVLDTVVGAMEKSAWEEKINALLEEQ